MGAWSIGVVSGIGVGCVYALIAVAYNLVLVSCGVFNFAQSALFSVTLVCAFALERSGASPLLALAAAVLIGIGLGYASELLAVRRFLGRPALFSGVIGLTEETLVSTLGLSLAITALLALVFGSGSYLVRSYVPISPIHLGALLIQPIYLVMLAAAAGVGLGLEIFLKRTEFGLVTRTIIDDPDGAALMGANPRRVISSAFVAAGAMGAVAAFLIAPLTGASAFVGGSLNLYGFAALAIGGFGSFRGALFGGLVVGLTSQLAQVAFEPQWAQPAVFALLMAVLAVRPAGLFGRQGMFGARGARDV